MEVLEISKNILNSSIKSIESESDWMDPTVDFKNIDVVDSSMEYEYFFREYLLKNRPCVIKDGKITKGWFCANQWTLNDGPNFQRLNDLYGDCESPVSNCKLKYYNAQQSQTMAVRKFLDYWEEFSRMDHPSEMPVLYLKDWHCFRDNPNQEFYKTPRFFGCDWLNEFYLGKPELNDDYMFVYMGPKGSWTPLHVDVFKSYSWSANIVGRKKWLLFPPGEETHLCDAFGQLLYDAELPENSWKINRNLKSVEVIQEAGEIIFVPSGWHHQVWNLEDTISINHNWINGCNIMSIWKSLKSALLSVMKEIQDCRNTDNWSIQCQTLLKATHGINYIEFYDFLKFIIEKRLNFILNPTDNFTSLTQIGINHVIFDLSCAKLALNLFINDIKIQNLYQIFGDEPNKLNNQIQKCLDSFDK